MKTLKIISLLLVVMCMASIALGQATERRYWLVNEAEVKSDQVSNFETSLKELIRLFGENQYPKSWMVAQGTGFTYYFFQEIETVAEFDTAMKTWFTALSKIDKDVSDNYIQCFKSSRNYIIRDRPARNYTPEEQRLPWSEYNYATWDVHYVKYGKIREYMQVLKEYKELCAKHNFDDPIPIIKGVIGTRDYMNAAVFYGKNAIDMRDQSKKLWGAIGQENKELYQRFVPLLEDRETIEFWIRRDLSYTANKADDSQ